MADTSIDEGALGLVAAIVQHNVDDLAHTTDWLIEAHKRDARQLARALLELNAAIDEVQVVDRRLLSAQALVSVDLDLADHLLSESADVVTRVGGNPPLTRPGHRPK